MRNSPIKLRYPFLLIIILAFFYVFSMPKNETGKQEYKNKKERCNYPFVLQLHSDFQREETPVFYYKNGFNLACEKRTKTA